MFLLLLVLKWAKYAYTSIQEICSKYSYRILKIVSFSVFELKRQKRLLGMIYKTLNSRYTLLQKLSIRQGH